MDRASEALVRAALHDLSNTLSGIQGVVDLSDPARSFSEPERERLQAILAEGFTILERTRHLALGTRPEGQMERGEAWRLALKMQMDPLSKAFRCPVAVVAEGDPDWDAWPGELLRSWALAVTRQVLPFLGPGEGLRIATRATPREWILTWSPLIALPDSLRTEDEGNLRDTAAHWARQVGHSLGISLQSSEDGLRARVPRF